MVKTNKNTKNVKKAKASAEQADEMVENMGDDDTGAGDYGDVLAFWEFPEFIKHQKGTLWYVAFTIVFVALLVYSYFSDNLLFAIILVIFAVLYFSSAKDEPKIVETALTEDGIFIGSKFIPYEDFQNFYIIYYPPEIKNLYFQPKGFIKQRMVIPLENQNPVRIREILVQYLDEDLKKEEIPTSEGISRILKL